MEKEEFLRILKKYQAGQASPEERRLIESWYEAMGDIDASRSDFSAKDLERMYWESINAEIRLREGPPRKKSTTVFLRVAVGMAASLLVAMVAYFALDYRTNTNTPTQLITQQTELPQIQWQREANTESSDRLITLPDGSRITLEPKSYIRYSNEFNQSDRTIHLEGEALFEVSRNEQKPFLVYANGVITKVLGTSFTVRAFNEDPNVIVSVRSGSVTVYTDQPDEKEEVILTPNQEIVYDKNEERMVKRIVENPQPLQIEPDDVRRLRFEEAPVHEIFEAIERTYGIEIEFDEAAFASCALTTSISDGDLYDRLDIVAQAIGASYVTEDGKIIILGNGCE